jgi:hypothetical protein
LLTKSTTLEEHNQELVGLSRWFLGFIIAVLKKKIKKLGFPKKSYKSN